MTPLSQYSWLQHTIEHIAPTSITLVCGSQSGVSGPAASADSWAPSRPSGSEMRGVSSATSILTCPAGGLVYAQMSELPKEGLASVIICFNIFQ